jgi:phage tail protein X
MSSPERTAPESSSAVAELTAVTDTIERSRDRIAQLAEPYLGTDREDVVSAVYEAERALLSAGRALQRALKVVQAGG